MHRHPKRVDAAVSIACFALTLLSTLGYLSFDHPDQVIPILAGAAATAAMLLLRRRRPVLTSFVCILIGMIPGQPAFPFAAVAALYALGIYAVRAHVWVAMSVIVGLGGVGAVPIVVVMVESGDVPGAVTYMGLALIGYLVPVLIGAMVRTQKRYVEEIVTRTAALEREREQAARLAAANERTRIAREMHDVVSHGLSVMVTLAEGAAADAAAGGTTAPAAMRLVAETGRSSLAEMRRLLGVLRSPDQAPELAPQPGSTDLPALIERFQVAGLPIKFARAGTAHGSPTLHLAVYRIIQEGLTNVLRHAPRTRTVDVRIDYAGPGVVVTVTNGPPTPRPVPGHGPGTGLLGIRERAEIFCGTVKSGPTDDGGWQLRVHLEEEAPT